MKWQAALYQCTYTYEFLNVFVWACDDELRLLTPKIIVILFTQALPMLIINFSRSINKNPGDFQYFQEEFQIPGDFQYFQYFQEL